MEQQVRTAPPPKSLISTLRTMKAGTSILFEPRVSITSVQSTLTRIKRQDRKRQYTSKTVGDQIEVWRLK